MSIKIIWSSIMASSININLYYFKFIIIQ
jgi:hypothetical protein